jgi:hypothetical protein
VSGFQDRAVLAPGVEHRKDNRLAVEDLAEHGMTDPTGPVSGSERVMRGGD